MGLFYRERYEQKGGKKYLVLIPTKIHVIIRIIFIVVIVFLTFLVVLFDVHILGNNLLKILKIFMYISIGLLVILCIPFKQQFKPIIARWKRKEVAVKGGTTIFNFKNPPETWIEQ